MRSLLHHLIIGSATFFLFWGCLGVTAGCGESQVIDRNWVTLLGEEKSDMAGSSISGCGDVNGDGFSDFLIGAYGAESLCGKVYLFLGRKNITFGPTSLATIHPTIVGDKEQRLGWKTCGSGDFDGDNLCDILISSSNLANDTNTLLLIRGRREWPDNLNNGDANLLIKGDTQHSVAGTVNQSWAGDVNSDGKSDIITCDPTFGRVDSDGGVFEALKGDLDDNGSQGRIYVMFGRALGNKNRSVLLTSADIFITGKRKISELQEMVTGIGDVNGDGIDDIAYCSLRVHRKTVRYEYIVNIILGPLNLPQEGNPSDEDELTIPLGVDAEESPICPVVAGIGDINADGFDDIAIGISGSLSGNKRTGKVFIKYGGRNWSKDESADANKVDAVFLGEDDGSMFGAAVSGCGDVNRDGCDDFLISAPEAEAYEAQEGRVYLVLGQRKAWRQEVAIKDNSLVYEGEKGSKGFGYSVAGVGDVNGDGYSDFAIGNGSYNENMGKVYLVLGAPRLQGISNW